MWMRDWRGEVGRTVEAHVAALRAAQADAEKTRRIRAGGELHHLVAWVREQLSDLEAGKRAALDGPLREDPVWVARAKVQLRVASRRASRGGRVPGFAKAVTDVLALWDERSHDLLGGTAPPPLPARSAPATLPAAAAPRPAPAPQPPAPAPAAPAASGKDAKKGKR